MKKKVAIIDVVTKKRKNSIICHLCGCKTKWYKRHKSTIKIKDPHYVGGYMMSFDGSTHKPIMHFPTVDKIIYFCDRTEYVVYTLAYE